MKVSKLERLLLDDTPLFQERHISLMVEKGSEYLPSKDDSGIYLVDLSDGVTWMLGFFLEGYSTLDSSEPRSLLATLQDSTITGVHILSARVCVYIRENKLCPILYINRYRPIHNGHTTPMSEPVEDILCRAGIKHWLTKFEQRTEAYFLAKCIQDEFRVVYTKHVEPHLARLTTAFITNGTPTSNNASGDACTPIPSSLQIQQQQQQLIPSISLQTQAITSSSLLGSQFPPTTTWEDIQQIMLDTFDDDEEFGLSMDGFIPITHSIWEQKETPKSQQERDDILATSSQQQLPAVSTIPMDEDQAHRTTLANDWYQLFLDVAGEETEDNRRKKLNAAKMEWMMMDTTLVLE